jgi:hypothetical protein
MIQTVPFRGLAPCSMLDVVLVHPAVKNFARVG